MHITFTYHAKQRMIQRNVSADQVAETLDSPDELIPGESGELVAIKRYGTREVQVVYRETDAGSLIVLTVMKPRIHD